MAMDLEEQYDNLYRYCYFKVHRRELAEDITQETMLRFLENRDSIGPGKDIAYLYTVARNLCVDAYRQRKEAPLDEEAADSQGEEAMLTRISVHMALAQLSATDRELLLLRYGNGVGVSDISRLYGISRFAVYRRLRQAQQQLKAALREEDVT